MSAPATPRRLITEAELAEYLAVDRATLRRWRRAGRAPQHVMIGRQARYSWPAVDAWLRARARQPR